MRPWPLDGAWRLTPRGPLLPDEWPRTRLESVADLGCGDGTNTARLRHVARRVWGVDSDADRIDRARALQVPGTLFVHRTAEAWLAEAEWPVDAIVCACLLAFVDDLDRFLRLARARVRKRLLLSDWHPMACWIDPSGRLLRPYLAEGASVPGEVHRTVSTVTNALLRNGFALRSLIESPARSTSTADDPVSGLPVAIAWDCVPA